MSFCNPRIHALSRRSGFTLIELLVSLAISSVLLLALSSLLTVSLNQWNRQTDDHLSRSDARLALATLAEDLQSIIVKSGEAEWLQVRSVRVENIGQTPQLLFMARPMGNGTATGEGENRGDVCAISYRLEKRDPFNGNDPVHALYRTVLTPDETIKNLGTGNLFDAYWSDEASRSTHTDNLLATHVADFSLSFTLRLPDGSVETLSPGWGLRCADQPRIGSSTDQTYPQGTRLVSISVELITIDRSAQSLLNAGTMSEEEIIRQFGHRFTTSIDLPAPVLP